MAGIYQHPKPDIFDINGVPLSGAKLYFYLTGTSTLQTVYQDEALSITHTNPVIADSSGRFPPIYLNDTVAYKITLNTSGDLLVYTVDPWKAIPITGTDVAARVQQIASNPLDYGAIGDGVADESSEVQSAITDATGTIDLLGKTYRCDSGLTITAGKRLVNGILDFSSCTDTNLINITGGSLGSQILLGADATMGVQQITVASTATLSAGDYLRIGDNQVWFTNQNRALVRVKTIDSGTTLTLEQRLHASYATAQSAEVRKVTMARGTVFRDVEIRAASLAVNQIGINAKYTDGVTVQACRFSRIYKNGILFTSSANGSVSDCDFADVTHATGKAVEFGDVCSNMSAQGNSYHKCTTAIGTTSSSGVNTHISIDGETINGSSAAAVFLDSGTQYAIISDCTITGTLDTNSRGIEIHGVDCTASNNTISLCREYGIFAQPQRALVFSTGGSGIPVSASNRSSVNIRGNHIELCGSDGIFLDTVAGSAAIVGATISGNHVMGCGGKGIFASADNFGIDLLSITENKCEDLDNHGIHVLTSGANVVSHVTITGNSINSIAASMSGIILEGSAIGSFTRATITGNSMLSVDRGVLVTGGVAVAITGNSILGATLGIQYSTGGFAGTVKSIGIKSNTVSDSAGGIIFSAGTGAVIEASNISDNALHCTSASYGIIYDITNTAIMRNIVFTDNEIQGAAIPVYYHHDSSGTSTSVNISSNVITGQSDSVVGIIVDNGNSGNCESFVIGSNAIYDVRGTGGGDTGIIINNSGSAVFRDVAIVANTIRANSGTTIDYGIFCVNVDELVINSNSMRDVITGIRTTNCERSSANGNQIRATTRGLYYVWDDGATQSSIVANGNSITTTAANGRGIRAESDGSGVVVNAMAVANNSITCEGNSSQGILIQALSAGEYNGLSLSGNTVKFNSSATGTGPGILLESPAGDEGDFDEVTIFGNTVSDSDGVGIYVSCQGGTDTSSNISVHGNTIGGAGADGIRVENVHKTSIIGNVVDGIEASALVAGIRYVMSENDTRKGVVISSNVIGDINTSSGSALGILVENTTNGTLDDICISSNSIAGDQSDATEPDFGIYVRTTSGTATGRIRRGVISDNLIRAGTGCVLNVTANTDIRDFMIVGNNITHTTVNSSECVKMEGAGEVANIGVLSNFLVDGNLAVQSTATTTTSVFVGGNYCLRINTATSIDPVTIGVDTAALADLPNYDV